MDLLRKTIALLVCASVFAYADGNTFNRVRYNGGSVSTTVKPDDWDNTLIVNSDAIVLKLKDEKSVSIPPKQVTSLSYGQEAHRRVGTAVGIGLVTLGAGALFALHKTKLHYIGVNYTDSTGSKQGILLQGDKSNFRAIIVALQGVTGAPVSVGEKDREEIPAGITVQAVAQPSESAAASVTPSSAVAPAAGSASLIPASSTEAAESLSLTSNPDGAEVYVDNDFIGNTPAVLKLKPGKHNIKVKMSGYKDWSRDLTAQPASEAHMTSTLEKDQ